MEISQSRTTTLGSVMTGVFNFATESRSCDEHGEFPSMKTPVGWSDCPVCVGRQMKAEQLRQEMMAAREHHMRRAEIPERYFDARFETYVPPTDDAAKALRTVQAYGESFTSARDGGNGLILCGGVGTGKTHLAISAMHSVLAQGYSARFAVLLDAMRSIKETYRKDSAATESAAIARFTGPDLLVLDEIGSQYGSDAEKMLLFDIMNERYNRMRPTILISNLAKPRLTEYLGDRVVDRMREGGGRMVVFDWASYRERAA